MPYKDALLFAITYQAVKAITSPLEEICRLHVSPTEKLRRAIVSHVRTVSEHLDALVVSQNDTRHLSPEKQKEVMALRDRYERLVQQILTVGIEAGEFCDDLAVNITSFALLGMCNWSFRWYRPYGPMSVDDIGETFARIVLEGMTRERNRSDRIRTGITTSPFK